MCSLRPQLKDDFVVVKDLKNASGFHFSENDGASITVESEPVWLAYVKVRVHFLLA